MTSPKVTHLPAQGQKRGGLVSSSHTAPRATDAADWMENQMDWTDQIRRHEGDYSSRPWKNTPKKLKKRWTFGTKWDAFWLAVVALLFCVALAHNHQFPTGLF